MDRCPTCQARLREVSVCPRCKTDLGRLLSIQAQADAWLRLAVAHLAAGDEIQALHAVEASLRLKREPLAVILKGFLYRRSQLEAKEALQAAEFASFFMRVQAKARELSRHEGESKWFDRLRQSLAGVLRDKTTQGEEPGN
jgi:hypothetical protein